MPIDNKETPMEKAMAVRPEQASDLANLNSYLEKGWTLKAMCATDKVCLVILEYGEKSDAHETISS